MRRWRPLHGDTANRASGHGDKGTPFSLFLSIADVLLCAVVLCGVIEVRGRGVNWEMSVLSCFGNGLLLSNLFKQALHASRRSLSLNLFVIYVQH